MSWVGRGWVDKGSGAQNISLGSLSFSIDKGFSKSKINSGWWWGEFESFACMEEEPKWWILNMFAFMNRFIKFYQ